MKKFEYRTDELNYDIGSNSLNEWLNKAGQRGWEVVYIGEPTFNFSPTTIVLKREIGSI